MSVGISKLLRIGVFYDGNYFFHVSNYYHYHHPERPGRISIAGLHKFIRHEVSKREKYSFDYCHIVDSHYFRGRPRAQDLDGSGRLLKERSFDDVLVREGVVTHYLPLGPGGEKGIDVWLALEAYELAIYKRFDVTVLIASDGDFLPLVRKLNTIGTRVMLLAWDFTYLDSNKQEKQTRTAQVLLDEVTHPVMMHQEIDDRSRRNDSLISELFVPSNDQKETKTFVSHLGGKEPDMPRLPQLAGKIQALKENFGFITPDFGGTNMFFHGSDVMNVDFRELSIGDTVRYTIGENAHGQCATHVYRVPDEH